MENCKNCKKPFMNGLILTCPNCGTTLCKDCAGETQNICPFCFTTLDYYI